MIVTVGGDGSRTAGCEGLLIGGGLSLCLIGAGSLKKDANTEPSMGVNMLVTLKSYADLFWTGLGWAKTL